MAVEASVTTNVKAIYEDGVFKPEGPVSLKDKTRVQLVVESTSPQGEDDDPTGWKTAESFIGMWSGGRPGEAVGAHHDRYIHKQQYAHMKHYLRPLLELSEWEGLKREEQIRRFAEACRAKAPQLQDLWDDMDRRPDVWNDALEYCAAAIRRESSTPASQR
jgi:hypothetical protein